jgi:hypothetical protein
MLFFINIFTVCINCRVFLKQKLWNSDFRLWPARFFLCYVDPNYFDAAPALTPGNNNVANPALYPAPAFIIPHIQKLIHFMHLQIRFRQWNLCDSATQPWLQVLKRKRLTFFMLISTTFKKLRIWMEKVRNCFILHQSQGRWIRIALRLRLRLRLHQNEAEHGEFGFGFATLVDNIATYWLLQCWLASMM